MADNRDLHPNAPAFDAGPGSFKSPSPLGTNPKLDKWSHPGPLSAHDGASMSHHKSRSSKMELAARRALNGKLQYSIENREEWGGMIYVLDDECIAMSPRTQHEPNKVDVGQHELNCGCPPGSAPVAYYHTHPLASYAGLPARYNEFSPEDLKVVADCDLEAAYLGSLDGSFFKYDSKLDKTIRLKGRLKNSS